MANKAIPKDTSTNDANDKVNTIIGNIEKGISLLSTMTKKGDPRHPLLIAQAERTYRLSNMSNKTCPCGIYSVRFFHHKSITTKRELSELKKRIETWGNQCKESLEKFYPNLNYSERFGLLQSSQIAI